MHQRHLPELVKAAALVLDEALEVLGMTSDFVEQLRAESLVVVDVLRGDKLLKPIPAHEHIYEAEHVR